MNSDRQLSHDILNAIERLRIMHDLIKEKKFDLVPVEELQKDLADTLRKLEADFQKLFQ